MDGQDWTPVVIKKKKTKSDHIKEGKSTLQKKYGGGGNRDVSNHLRKLDEDEIHVPKKVSTDLKMAIQKGRQSKGFSQKELAQKLNVPVSTIQQYESGKAIPNGNLISRMGRVLGVQLSNKSKKKKK